MLQLCLLGLLVGVHAGTCAYDVDQNFMPYKSNQTAFDISKITAQCAQYASEGGMGCCNKYNDQNSKMSYDQIDGVFGSLGGACDICAINLKRFWCEYACSDRQSDFMETAKELEYVPDPQKPGAQLLVQRVNLTVFGQTACDLYDSCKRNPFVASVSAMGSPAGFLTFQGHNAVNNAHQLIEIIFSDDPAKALTLSNITNKTKSSELTPCNYKTNETTLHGFTFSKNCTCNCCEESCDNAIGFIYTQSGVLESFDWVLVGSVYLGFGIAAAALTLYRRRKTNKNQFKNI